MLKLTTLHTKIKKSPKDYWKEEENNLERKLKIIFISTLYFPPIVILLYIIQQVLFYKTITNYSIIYYLIIIEIFLVFELILILYNKKLINLSSKLMVYIPILSIWILNPLNLINYNYPERNTIPPAFVIIIMLSISTILFDIKDMSIATFLGLITIFTIGIFNKFQNVSWIVNNIILVFLFYFIFIIVIHYKLLTRNQLIHTGQRHENIKNFSLESIKANKKLYNSITHEFLTPLHLISGNLQELEANIEENSEQTILLSELTSILDSIKLWIYYLVDYNELNNFLVLKTEQITLYDLVTDFTTILLNNSALAKQKLTFFIDSKNQSLVLDKIRIYLIIVDTLLKLTKKSENLLNNNITINVSVNEEEGKNYLSLYFNLNSFENESHVDVKNATFEDFDLNLKLIKSMNGSFCLESYPLTLAFNFKILIKIESQIKENTKANSKNEPVNDTIKILVADDFEDNRELIKIYLKDLKTQIDEADNGELALSLLKENEYDFALLDIKMPAMNGVEVTRRYRTWEGENRLRRTPIIFLTAFLNDIIDQEEFKLLVDKNILNKPFKKENLINYISELGLLN